MDKKEFFIKLLDILLKNPKVIVFLWISLFGLSGYSVLDYMDVGVGAEETPVVEAPMPNVIALPPTPAKVICNCDAMERRVYKRIDEFHK